jgi:hypothetical protein
VHGASSLANDILVKPKEDDENCVKESNVQTFTKVNKKNNAVNGASIAASDILVKAPIDNENCKKEETFTVKKKNNAVSSGNGVGLINNLT